MHIPSAKCIFHTANKDIDNTTLCFLEKVTIISSSPSIVQPATTQTELSATHSNLTQTRHKHKRPSATTPHARPSKKQKTTAGEMSEEEIAANAAKLAEELATIQALREKIATAKQRQTEVAIAKPKKKAATSEPLQYSPPKFKIVKRGLPTISKHTTTPSQTTSPSDTPTVKLIMSPKEASKLIPQEYETIFHNLHATWIRPNPIIDPNVAYLIAHLPPFLYSLVAFHNVGRDKFWYINKYINCDSTAILWTSRFHMSKEAILEGFGSI